LGWVQGCFQPPLPQRQEEKEEVVVGRPEWVAVCRCSAHLACILAALYQPQGPAVAAACDAQHPTLSRQRGACAGGLLGWCRSGAWWYALSDACVPPARLFLPLPCQPPLLLCLGAPPEPPLSQLVKLSLHRRYTVITHTHLFLTW